MTRRPIAAILLPVAACALQWALWDHISPFVWFLFFPAAYVSAWIGGLWGGLAGTTIAAVLVWYVFMPPSFSFALANPSAGLSILMFLVMGALFAVFFERLRKVHARSDTRFEATFEQAAVGMAMLAPDGRWLRVNRRLCQIVGYDHDALLARTLQDITHPDDLDRDLEYVRQLLSGDIPSYAMEKRYRRQDGGLVWVKLTVALVRQPNGSPDYFVSVIEDIQALKYAEEVQMESERRYRELVENANSAILCWSRDGRITFFSPFAERLFGWCAEEVIGQPVSLLVPAQDSAGTDLTGLVEDIASRPERYLNNINENICRDGRRLWMSWTNRALCDAEGQVTGILAIGNDITERKRDEEELRLRNEALERFNQAAIGRELQMIALKREVNDLSRQLGRAAPFDLSFVETSAASAESRLP